MRNFLFFAILISTSSFADSVMTCSRSYLGQNYRAVVSLEGERPSIRISSSNNAATRRGEQSEGPVAFQSFWGLDQRTVHNVNVITLNEAIAQHGRQDIRISYARIRQSGSEFSLLLKGPAFPLNRLKFQNCKSVSVE